jgi:23S rRNA (adenine2503-C2)-methyltransferase
VRSPEEWTKVVQSLGGRAFHGKQIFRWIHVRGVTDPEQMSDLPASLRRGLCDAGVGEVPGVTREQCAADGTRKLLVTMRDGASVETVLIPEITRGACELPSPVGDGAPSPLAGDVDADADALDDDVDEATAPGHAPATRVTQCISTQVGCAMGCTFCATGASGFQRNLGADEIVAQVLLGRRALTEGEALRGVVLMGMGEPLHNYEATTRALRVLLHREGIGLSSRRVTVSTVGLVPQIARLGVDFQGQIGLAVSLHAASDEVRSRLVPVNRRYPIADVLAALRAYPLPQRRRITIEYTLVAGLNDGTVEAKKLARMLAGIPVKVNLIPMNPIPAVPLAPPALPVVLAFQRVLCDAGYSCFIRRRRGDDVSAACGQLAAQASRRAP